VLWINRCRYTHIVERTLRKSKVDKDDRGQTDIVQRSSGDFAGGESEILRRGLELIRCSEEAVFSRDEVIKLLHSGPDTLIFNCVLERGGKIAEKVSKKIPLKIIAETKDWREAVVMCKSIKPNLIMTCSCGLPMIGSIRKIDKKIAIAVFTIRDSMINMAIEAGADAYALLPGIDEELIVATKLAIQNRASAVSSI
jgi:hypothetical protein